MSKRNADETGSELQLPAPKRLRSDSDNSSSSSFSFSSDTSSPAYVITLRFLLNSKEAGSCIGKDGTVISEARKCSTANILISKSVPHSQHRVMTLSGFAETVFRALLVLLPKIEAAAYDQSRLEALSSVEASARPPFSIRLLFSTGMCGRIIGKAGLGIHQLQNQSGARVTVENDTMPGSDEKPVIITGSAQVIMNCLDLIINSIKGFLAKGCQGIDPMLPFTPGASDSRAVSSACAASLIPNSISTLSTVPSFSLDPVVETLSHRAASGNVAALNALKALAGVDSQAQDRRSSAASAASYSLGSSPFPINLASSARQGSFPSAASAASPSLSQIDSGPEISSTMSIQNSVVGAVLGPKGVAIASIRQRSGAKIHIPAMTSSPGTERTITITGTQRCHDAAVAFIQQVIDQKYEEQARQQNQHS